MTSPRVASPVPFEEDEQMALFEWADRMLYQYPELTWMHAIHNGLRLSAGMRLKAKRLGTRRGVADISLPVARGGYHGLYIEMKRQRGGSMEPEQRLFADHCLREGYLYLVGAGWEKAAVLIELYLKGHYHADRLSGPSDAY